MSGLKPDLESNDERSESFMTVKSQLNACRDSLMAGMRAATRGPAPSDRAEAILRACLDLVEHMSRQSKEVSVGEVDTTLRVHDQAVRDIDNEGLEAHAPTTALRNAKERLIALKQEMAVK